MKAEKKKSSGGVRVVNESRIYGINACKAFFKQRPDDLIRVYLTSKSKRSFREVMRFCVEHKLAYHIRPREELESICQSQHHEEVCFVVKAERHLPLKDFLKRGGKGKRGMILALDGVVNPHNLGALMRVCAHFGVRHVLSDQPDALRSAAALRTSEGGGEVVQVVACRGLNGGLEELKQAGYRLVSTSSHRGIGLSGFRWPDRTVLILGSEADGVKCAIAKNADMFVRIDGTGAVESLNVSCAASVLLYDYASKTR